MRVRPPTVVSCDVTADMHKNADHVTEDTKSNPKTEPSAEDHTAEGAQNLHTRVSEGGAVPLSQVEKSATPQIEGAWILPRNLWIILRYRIPRALTYGLNGKLLTTSRPNRTDEGLVDVASGQSQKGTADEQRMLAVHQASEQYGNEVSSVLNWLILMSRLNICFRSCKF